MTRTIIPAFLAALMASTASAEVTRAELDAISSPVIFT